jgi:hypothetical protein
MEDEVCGCVAEDLLKHNFFVGILLRRRKLLKLADQPLFSQKW